MSVLGRNRIGLTALYADAPRAMPERIDGQQPLPLPDHCPITLHDLLSEE